MYYKSASTLIDKQLNKAFKHKKGPGETPGKTTNEEIQGIIVPRFSYYISGPCAAWAYKALGEAKRPDVYILLSQVEADVSKITDEPFQTPYGIMRVDQKLNRLLETKEEIQKDDASFDNDAHIRSQLPFLQFTTKQDESIKILPLQVGTRVKLKQLSVNLKEALLDSDKTAAIILPTNLTRFGTNHGYVPFSQNPKEQVTKLDKGMIDAIKSSKPQNVLKYYEKHAMNTENIVALIFMLIFLNPTNTLLEQYYHTTAFTDDKKNFISQSSFVIK